MSVKKDAPKSKQPSSPSRKHGGANTRSRRSDCLFRLHALLKKEGKLSYDGAKRISFGTSRSRSAILRQAFEYLASQGMCPCKPKNFKPKHMAKLVAHWEEQGLAASTLQLRFSIFSTFCFWIGKAGMLGEIAQYLKNPDVAKRSYMATEDKSWSKKGIDVQSKIAEVETVDPRAAIHLKLEHAFGLRLQESVTLHPKEADHGSCLYVAWGTKGGRDRLVRIETDYQRQVIEEAKRFVNSSTGSLIPDTFKRRSWLRYVYRVYNKCGIGRKHGIAPHGLRHQCANDMYQCLTGQKSPVRGGQTVVDRQVDDNARLIVAEYLGHSRKQISGAYLGGILRERARNSEKKGLPQ